jgi:hypothetical protein
MQPELRVNESEPGPPPRILFLITQQFSLRIPDLQAVPVDYVVIWTQRFGGFERQFERLKCLHSMAAVGPSVLNCASSVFARVKLSRSRSIGP